MRICMLTDCDCNKEGCCTDTYAATRSAWVTGAHKCQSYNPREEDDDERDAD